MSQIDRISLTNEERLKLSGKLIELGLKQKDLAKAIGVSQSTIVNIVTGKFSLNYELAKKIYDISNQDHSLSFLVSFESQTLTESQPLTGTKKSWEELYQDYVLNLNSIYHNQPTEQKGIIISELEKLIGRYS